MPACNINGYNYFKLRDIAALVNNTDAAFNISYNPLSSSVYIYPGEPYRFVGNELSDSELADYEASASNCTIYNGSSMTSYTPYVINGNIYFKLRDICRMAGIDVGWDDKTGTISLSTN